MAHIILTGATGQAGAAILSYAISSPAIARVSVLSRRPVKLAENEPKANVLIHTDFSTYPEELLDQLQGATGCIWAQGISSRGMTEAEYAKITVDYPLTAARAFAGLSDNMKFVYMSGEGANMDETKVSMMFAKFKGRAEKRLLELQMDLPSLDVYNIRPALINPEYHYQAERKPTIQDRASSVLGGIFERVRKVYVISTMDLAKACMRLAVGDGKPISPGEGVEADGRLLRNSALRHLAAV